MQLKLQKFAMALAMGVSLSAVAETKSEDVFAEMRFTSGDMLQLFEQDSQPIQLAVLSPQEMKETDGAIAPLVAVGIMAGSRFIVQRWVTQRVAQNMVRSGARNILAPNRSVAKNIAGRGAIREFHPGAGSRYTHFHPNPRNGSHVWYGSPR